MWDGWVATELHHAHIVGHWNYAPDTIKPVRVVSSADRVELFLDGASLGFGQRSSRFLFTFPNILWKPGVLRAVGFDAAGAPLCSAECRTAGAPALLRLTSWTDPRGLRADGADLALVQVEVTDADGNRCPTAMNTIDFALEGPAEWRGGIAQGPDNHILATSLPVECGVNRVLIRSTPQPGTVRLAARSPGLESAFLELASLAAEVSGGLSTDLPGVGLSSYLDRGPTPAGPSYAITRWPVAVAGATAGSNADQVELSLDDNELTRWENDGALASAWITFRFDEPQVVNQVVLKLQGWRTTGYPIRLIAGGRTLWSRETPRSLGYVTLTFDAVETDSLTIALDGVTRVADAFGQIVEVGGAVDQADETARGRLAIVEAEFYGPLAND
jgi:beta-galactosidase